MNYGRALRIARAIAGLEQKELARQAGLDPSHISLIERGSRQPSMGAIGKLCKALDISEPLLTMLAAEQSDLKGIGEQEFERIGAYLARFLIRNGHAPKRRKAKRPSDS
jgi:transcriptional regulator with XRE-family HTH domain